MKRIDLAAALAVAVLGMVLTVPLKAQDAKIKSAMSAAPASVSARATIMDWPAEKGGEPTVLREGTNTWTCFPDAGDTAGTDPMCVDAPWLELLDAWLDRRVPNIKTAGFGYMLGGDSPMSNTDPFATEETADNEWIKETVPHLMIVLPAGTSLEGIPTAWDNGGPWVMWRDTPYAHIMVPMPRHGMMSMSDHDM